MKFLTFDLPIPYSPQTPNQEEEAALSEYRLSRPAWCSRSHVKNQIYMIQ